MNNYVYLVTKNVLLEGRNFPSAINALKILTQQHIKSIDLSLRRRLYAHVEKRSACKYLCFPLNEAELMISATLNLSCLKRIGFYRKLNSPKHVRRQTNRFFRFSCRASGQRVTIPKMKREDAGGLCVTLTEISDLLLNHICIHLSFHFEHLLENFKNSNYGKYLF